MNLSPKPKKVISSLSEQPTKSIRTLLLALALIPPLITGVIHAISQYKYEPTRQRNVLLEGVVYATQTFAVNATDLMESEGKSLNDKRLRVTLQTNAENLIHKSKTNTFPVRDILMTNGEGMIMMASSNQFEYGSAGIRNDWQETWRKQNPELVLQIAEIARQAQRQDAPATLAVPKTNALISAVPLAGPSGVAIMIMDDQALHQLALRGVENQLLLTLMIALGSSIISVFIANNFAQRILMLTYEARRIGEARTLAELDRPIHIRGNDELSILARNLDRLRAGARATMQFQLNQRRHQ